MKLHSIVALALVLVLATSAFGLEKKAFQLRDDFGTEPLIDCFQRYYYYIPCPTYSWFWGVYGHTCGDIWGAWFKIGDLATGASGCDPDNCMDLAIIRVLDFAGFGIYYPGLFTVDFDVYCADADGCPVGPSLWTSGPFETGPGWNYVYVDPPISICECVVQADPPSAPRILVTATHTGTECTYPQWGMDNISTAIEVGCVMHDYGCLPGLYPRPMVSNWAEMHSGYYGNTTIVCPPAYYCDGRDSSPNCDIYGLIELAWTVYITCSGPTANEPSSWGNIKSMYR